MNSFTLFVALATVLTSCEANDWVRGIVVRQTNTSAAGGFATRAASCSANQVDCGGGVTQEICCPSGTFCFNSDDEVCCPTNEDCNPQFFAAPKCADPSWYLCTDYSPNIPSYVPNDPGYWCCPVGTPCVVSGEGGFVCGAAGTGDVAGLTVASGQAPTQASTATTLPTPPSGAPAGTKTPGTTAGNTAGTAPSSSSPSSPAKNSSIRTSSFLSVPTSLGIFVALSLAALL